MVRLFLEANGLSRKKLGITEEIEMDRKVHSGSKYHKVGLYCGHSLVGGESGSKSKFFASWFINS